MTLTFAAHCITWFFRHPHLCTFRKSSDSPMFLELIRSGVSILTQISRVYVLNGNAAPSPAQCVGLWACREEGSVTLWCPLKKKVSTSSKRKKYIIKPQNSLPELLKRWCVEETGVKRLNAICPKLPDWRVRACQCSGHSVMCQECLGRLAAPLSCAHRRALPPVLLLLLGRQKRNLVGGSIGVWESSHEIIWATRPAV